MKTIKIVIISLMSLILLSACGKEEEKKDVQEGEEKVKTVLRDKNIEATIIDETDASNGIKNYKKIIYQIKNVSEKEISYTFEDTGIVDYILYKKDEEDGYYDRMFRYTEKHKQHRGVIVMDIKPNETEERRFELFKIPKGEYKIEMWFNIDKTKKLNVEEYLFTIE